jgi:2-acylglycerol O-acyltransferase 2
LEFVVFISAWEAIASMARTQAPPTESALVEEAPEKQELPPKSYAEVVEAGAPVNEGNGVEESNGTNGVVSPKRTNGTAAVLRIVDTGAAVAEKKEDKVKGDRPREERNGSDRDHTAAV